MPPHDVGSTGAVGRRQFRAQATQVPPGCFIIHRAISGIRVMIDIFGRERGVIVICHTVT